HDARRATELIGEAAEKGLQLSELLDQLIDYWRDLMIVQCAGEEGQDLSVTAKNRAALVQQATSVKLDTILAGLDVLNATSASLDTRVASEGLGGSPRSTRPDLRKLPRKGRFASNFWAERSGTAFSGRV